jgi:hypothetical protein
VGLFLDLTKAFDVISHNIVLAKLQLYGLRGNIHSWMSSYLSGRTQFVEIQHVDEKTSNLKTFTSSLKVIKHGVPQGSVLGPLLFLLFINDLPQALQETKVVLFADDTNILIDKNLTSLNEKTLTVWKQLDNWFYENRLIINMDKTEALLFQGRGPSLIHRPAFCLNNKVIT